MASSCKTSQKTGIEASENLLVVTLHDYNNAMDKAMNIIFHYQPLMRQVSFDERLQGNIKIIKCRFAVTNAGSIEKMKEELRVIPELIEINVQRI